MVVLDCFGCTGRDLFCQCVEIIAQVGGGTPQTAGSHKALLLIYLVSKLFMVCAALNRPNVTVAIRIRKQAHADLGPTHAACVHCTRILCFCMCAFLYCLTRFLDREQCPLDILVCNSSPLFPHQRHRQELLLKSRHCSSLHCPHHHHHYYHTMKRVTWRSRS